MIYRDVTTLPIKLSNTQYLWGLLLISIIVIGEMEFKLFQDIGLQYKYTSCQITIFLRSVIKKKPI